MTSDKSRCPSHDSSLARTVREFCLRDFQAPGPAVREAFATDEIWQGLAGVGTELWLDTGDVDAIRALWTREFRALTTNNTLLNKEVQKGIYDALVPEATATIRGADASIGDDLLVQEIAFVLNAVHGLKLVSTFDADVSVELHTNLARDADASYRYGKRFAAISPERFIVKVPLTPEGVIAARRLSDDGIRVNFTLGFSARENYVIAIGARPTYCNVFMGRCGAFVKDGGLGDGANVGEKATLASQRLMRRVRDEHGIEVRQIGASMRNGQQAIDLMGLDVYTMPTGVAEEYHAAAPGGADLRDRTGDDPEVTLHVGRDAAAERLDAMWSIDDAMHAAMRELHGADVAAMTGDDLRGLLAGHEVGDVFPTLDAADRARVAADGKIPRYEPWVERVRAGTASWDGMLTEAALASFTADQKKLDDRIREHL